MSIGTGIFLSALIFAALLLYVVTRDRWDWMRLVRRLGIGAAALVLVAIVLGAGFWAYEKIANLPRRQTGYAELSIGMKMLEVRYVKGEPSYVTLPPEKTGPYKGSAQLVYAKDFKAGQSAESFNSWGYQLADGKSYVDVEFDPKTKRVVTITCYSGGIAVCPPLLAVVDGDSEESIVDRLGKADDQALEVGSGVKRLSYTSLNVRYYLLKKQVYMMEIGR